MKLKLSFALNIVLVLFAGFLSMRLVSQSVDQFYAERGMSAVAAGCLAQLRQGDTNLAWQALSIISSNAGKESLLQAGVRVGVYKLPQK